MIPMQLLFDSEIYNKILSSIWKGLKSEHLGADDSRVVVSSYMECALYCCIRLMYVVTLINSVITICNFNVVQEERKG